MKVWFIGLHKGKGSQPISGNRSGDGQGAALSESVGGGPMAEVNGALFEENALRFGSHSLLLWD